jgi:hypothetical protein
MVMEMDMNMIQQIARVITCSPNSLDARFVAF